MAPLYTIAMNKGHLLDRFINASLWSAGSSYGFFAINFLGQLGLARLLIPSDFGVYAFTLSLVEIMAIFISTLVTPLAYINSEGTQEDFNACWFLNISAFFVYIIVALLGMSFLTLLDKAIFGQIFFVVCLARGITGISDLYLSPLQKKLQFKVSSIIQGVGSSGGLLLAILIAYFFRNVWSLALREIMSATILVIFSYSKSPMRYRKSSFKISMIHQLKFGYKTMISRGLEVLYYRLPDIFIQSFLGRIVLGNFYQARYVSYIPLKLMEPFTHQVLFSFLSSIKNDKEQLSNRLFWINYLLIRLLVPIAFFILLFGKDLILFLYGPGWILSGQYFRIFSLFILFSPLYASLLSTCYSLGKQKFSSQAYLLGIALFVGLTYCYSYGMVAATAFSGGLIVAYFYLVFRLRGLGISLPLMKIFLYPALASSVSILFYYFMKNPIISYGLFLLLYFGILIIERKLLLLVVERIFKMGRYRASE